ncbi:MAG: hypothetical protein FJW92_03450 [Actinobacteria bacterium]|nr:hypothetical protein [Actinomycetota bacterium]
MIVWGQMAIGLAYNLGVFAVIVGIAFLRFESKDILSWPPSPQPRRARGAGAAGRSSFAYSRLMSDLTRRQILGRAAMAAGGATAVAMGTSATGVAAAAPRRAGSERLPWGMFRCSAWNDEALFAFGAASSGAAEVGEIMELVRVVRERTGDPVNPTTADFDVLVDQWQQLAARLERRAAQSQAAGNLTSARQQYLRASSYRSQALFFILGTSRPGREQAAFQACEQDWLSGIALWDVPVVQASIPYQGLSMPAYLFRPAPDGLKRPTVIVCNGSDGQNVDVLCAGITAGLDRGYNVLTFEAPGQMSLLFNQQQPMQSDWAPIINAVIGWLTARSDVDATRIAAVGISLLGGVIASAGAASPGLAAMIMEPGAYSLAALWGDKKSVKAVEETLDAPKSVQREVAAGVNGGLAGSWKYMTPLERFTVSKRSELYTRNALVCARQGRPPSDYYGLLQAILAFQYQSTLPKVGIPTYVCDNQLDEFFGPQAKKIPSMLTGLTGDQKYLRHLTLATGTQFHDQPLGPQAAQEFIFDWLDAVLGL